MFWANNTAVEYFELDFLNELAADLFKSFVEDRTAKFYMCGSENMQKYVFSQLQDLGENPENVETEKIGIYMKKSPEPV